MTFKLTMNGADCQVVVSGEIDERGAEELKKRFREVQAARPQRVVIDFKEVTHIGSAGIGKLLVLYKDLAVQSATLHLVNVPHVIYRLFCEMKLNAIFSIAEINSQTGGKPCGVAGH